MYCSVLVARMFLTLLVNTRTQHLCFHVYTSMKKIVHSCVCVCVCLTKVSLHGLAGMLVSVRVCAHVRIFLFIIPGNRRGQFLSATVMVTANEVSRGNHGLRISDRGD